MNKLPMADWTALRRFVRRQREALFLIVLVLVALTMVVFALRWPTIIVSSSEKGPEGIREARDSLLKIVAGFTAVVAGWLAYQRLRVSRSQHVTDLFSRAVEQLGSDSIDVRIGGIYSLERIARDSPVDHPAVMEVLLAFVRNLPQRPKEERGDRYAALQAFLRRKRYHDAADFRPDFSGAHLEEAGLMHAELTGADFSGAHLQGAMLAGAQLEGAWFTDAHLEDVQFYEAVLRGAMFEGAHLTGTAFHDVDLSDAYLHGAFDVEQASFLYADLTGAMFDDDRLPPTQLPQGSAGGGRV